MQISFKFDLYPVEFEISLSATDALDCLLKTADLFEKTSKLISGQVAKEVINQLGVQVIDEPPPAETGSKPAVAAIGFATEGE